MTDPRIEQKAWEAAAELCGCRCHSPEKHNMGSCTCGGGWECIFGKAQPLIAAALQSAVAEEREECRKDTCAQCREGKIPATESALGTQRFWHGDLFCQASAIRARGQKAEETAKEHK